MSALALRGVVKRLSGPAAPVLDGIDLVIEPGRVVGILGANGAGKTTLLRVVAGLLVPDAGSVALGALDPETTALAYRRRVALLSSGGGLYARLDVRRHLRWWAAMAFVPAGERAEAVARSLHDFGLEDLAGRRVERLSAGQRQRVRLALAFLPRPALLALDEPDIGLDDDGLTLLAERLREHAGRGGIAVWTAPDGRAEAVAADELRHLAAGRLA